MMEGNMPSSFIFSRKVLLLACIVTMAVCVFVYTMKQQSGSPSVVQFIPAAFNVSETKLVVSAPNVETPKPHQHPPHPRKDVVDNNGAVSVLAQYKGLFAPQESFASLPNPNAPDTVKTWWQAAAMIDWYINAPVRYQCRNRVAFGNWHVCQDPPYTVKPPCLVYSFGINFDFSFDDDMARLGCEVHSFDPSMNQGDHKRGDKITFHNMGLGNINTDSFNPRKDSYVQNKQVWKMRTLKAVTEELGHTNRVIDVFKMDIEGHEWSVLDNIMESGMFKYVRQYMLEFHLFPDWPAKEDYVLLYKTYTKLREMGMREFATGPHPKTLDANNFNNQGDIEYVNAFFEEPDHIE